MPRSLQGAVRKSAPARGPSDGSSTVRGRGRFFVISTGPAGPRTATLQALEALGRMHAIAAPEQQVKLFAEYIGEKPVLFDPWDGLFDYGGKKIRDLDGKERLLLQRKRLRLRAERVGRIKDLLFHGKDVGLLETGNPCLFGPSHWYIEQFDHREVVIIPGMGCDAAAMVALGASTIPAHDVRFLVQTSPFSIMGQDFVEDYGLLRDLLRHSCTLVFYMALWDRDRLLTALCSILPRDTPCAVVYWAGYPEREKVIRGRLEDMEERLSGEVEDFMGLILVGRFLEGKPYEESMRKITQPGRRIPSGGKR